MRKNRQRESLREDQGEMNQELNSVSRSRKTMLLCDRGGLVGPRPAKRPGFNRMLEYIEAHPENKRTGGVALDRLEGIL